MAKTSGAAGGGRGGAAAPAAAPRDFGSDPEAAITYAAARLTPPPLSRPEEAAVQQYNGTAYQLINDVARGTGNVTAHARAHMEKVGTIGHLDAALAKSSVPETIAVYRGIKDSTLAFGHADAGRMVGRVVTEKAFVSTSLVRAVAEGFHRESGALLRIVVPAGSKGLFVGNVRGVYGSNERELLLPRGTSYKITGRSKDEHGRTVLHAEIRRR